MKSRPTLDRHSAAPESKCPIDPPEWVVGGFGQPRAKGFLPATGIHTKWMAAERGAFLPRRTTAEFFITFRRHSRRNSE
jgi:hypothetical protein